MSTSIGVASDYVDLLKRLDTFLTATGHAWRKSFAGTGTGDLIDYIGTATTVAETFTLTAINATTFSVVGSVSGALANATVGTPYTSAVIGFTITAGGTAYQAGDVWTISTSPKWTRLRAEGWADPRFASTNLTPLANLFDGTTISAIGPAQTLVFFEFEAVVPSRIRRLTVRCSASATNRTPTSYAVRWRDAPDDPWTTAETLVTTWDTTSQTRSLVLAADPGEHLYWRIEGTGQTSTTNTEIAQLLMHPTAVPGSLGDRALGLPQEANFTWLAPGLDGLQQIFVTANTRWNDASDIWNLVLRMPRQWSADDSIFVQPSVSPWTSLLLTTNPINYWFIVNGQRAVIVTRHSGVMQIGYVGFGLPYEPPSLHAYPAICAGSLGGTILRFSENNTAQIRFPIDPGTNGNQAISGVFAYYPDATWRAHGNRSSTLGPDGGPWTMNSAVPGFVWPTGSYIQSQYVANIDGSRPLIPCVLASTQQSGVNRHVWGEYDGLYWTTGFSTAPEAIIREARYDHLVCNNIFRTGPEHFGAVRLD